MTNIVMYSSDFCPFCDRAKALLASKSAKYHEIVVDGKPDIRQEMTAKSGQTSVPQIWINDNHIGGCDDIYALDKQGKLDALLNG